MEDMTKWVGILVFGCGLYSLYAAYQMKFLGVINTTLLLSKEFLYKKCKDKDAYIKETFPALLIFAIATTFCGAVDLINSYITELGVLYYVSLGIFIASFFYFVAVSQKTRKKYY